MIGSLGGRTAADAPPSHLSLIHLDDGLLRRPALLKTNAHYTFRVLLEDLAKRQTRHHRQTAQTAQTAQARQRQKPRWVGIVRPEHLVSAAGSGSIESAGTHRDFLQLPKLL